MYFIRFKYILKENEIYFMSCVTLRRTSLITSPEKWLKGEFHLK